MKTPALMALVCSLAACSQAAPSVRFAIAETSAARWIGSTRLSVIDRNVNMMEPIGLEATNDGTVTISYARRGRDGVRTTIDAASLVPRGTSQFVFAEHARRAAPPCAGMGPAVLTTASGYVRLWTDETSGRIVADGTGSGAPVPVVPADTRAVGQPKAVMVDERRVVFVFFGEGADGFELVVGAFDRM
jgi:hypothetical protein